MAALFKPIRVRNDYEFEKLRDRIDLEVSHARHHWQLLNRIEEASSQFALEMNESNTFW